MQWLQNQNQSSVDNLNHLRHEDNRCFRNKKKEYLKAKTDVLVTNSKVKNIRDLYQGIIDWKKVYQPRTKIVMDEKGDLVTDSHTILARWRKHFSQVLNVHMISDVRQTEIHTAEPQVSEPSAFEVEMAIEKPTGNKSPDIDQIQAELIKAGGRTICSESHKLITSIWSKEELPEEWKELIIVLIYKKGDKTDCTNYRVLSLCLLHAKFHPTSCCQG
jgi:hypothetical protein